MRLDGVITINFDDVGAVEREAYATIAVSIDIETESLVTPDPDEYGWMNFFPGKSRWTGSAMWNEVILSNLTRNAAQQALQELAFSRTRFDITFTSITGTTYASSCWIPSIQFNSGDQQILRASVQFRGKAKLTPTVPDPVEPEPEIPIVTDVFYITDPATGTNGDLRKLTI